MSSRPMTLYSRSDCDLVSYPIVELIARALTLKVPGIQIAVQAFSLLVALSRSYKYRINLTWFHCKYVRFFVGGSGLTPSTFDNGVPQEDLAHLAGRDLICVHWGSCRQWKLVIFLMSGHLLYVAFLSGRPYMKSARR